MPLRLGFDMDGVVADLNAALLREALLLFPGDRRRRSAARVPQDAAPPAPPRVAHSRADPAESCRRRRCGLTPRQQRQLWDAVKSIANFWETLDETEPGIVARIAETARARRWEIDLPHQPALDRRRYRAGTEPAMAAPPWLRSPVRSSSCPPRAAASPARWNSTWSSTTGPENCLDITIDSKARAILIWRGEESSVSASARRLGIGGTASVAECLDLLVDADEPAAAPVSMGRLRKLLGLKTAVPATRVATARRQRHHAHRTATRPTSSVIDARRRRRSCLRR